MVRSTVRNLQDYPRRKGDYLADDKLFVFPNKALTADKLSIAIDRAFERCLLTKKGGKVELTKSPTDLVKLCLSHLKERSDPILSPFFLSKCDLQEVFELDAIAHEMQRHRMRVGVFYQYLIIELMRSRFDNVLDGKREGDIEAEIHPPSFNKGLRLFISVKKSADTVGGQDVAGMFRRLEDIALEDKNLTCPYLGVVVFATPHKGIILPFEQSRFMKRNRDGHPFSPNCEVWSPGFVFPFISGLHAQDIYKCALLKVANYLPFNTLANRKECSDLLAHELNKLGLVNTRLNRIDPAKFQSYILQEKSMKEIVDEQEDGEE